MQGTPPATPERLATPRNLPVEATRRLLRRNAYVNLYKALGGGWIMPTHGVHEVAGPGSNKSYTDRLEVTSARQLP